ncbi:MAG: DUF3526 domain-containing protein [Polyangiales bacterium]
MIKWRTLLMLELKQVLRARAFPATALILLVAGVAVVWAGSARVRDERSALAMRETFLAEQASRLQAKHSDDLGLLLYHLAMPTEHAPNPWTPLATGLRDVHPYSQHLRMLGLVQQLYAGETGNPLTQLTGSFDYAFVVVFLLPLLVIGLGYDVRSRDVELGVEPLLRSQPTRTSRLVALRLALRSGLVAALALGSFVVVVLALGLPRDARIVWWMLALLGYIAFWAAVVLAVSTLRRASGWNATVLMGVWIALCVLLPALANAALMRAPTRGGVALTLAQREVMNAGWDKPKRVTMDPFLARRPAYRNVPIAEDTFSWPWYYAMHEVADRHVAADVAAYDAVLATRERSTAAVAMLLPPLALCRLLTHLGGTDLTALRDYRASVAAYHEALKQVAYPLVFGNAKPAALRLDALPRHHFEAAPRAPHLGELLGVWMLAAFVLMVALSLGRERSDAARLSWSTPGAPSD